MSDNENQSPSLNHDIYEVEMDHIVKVFPGIRAVDDVCLRLKKGEIHALLGENGAGKSTLMSILFGLYRADEGKIYIRGKEVEIKDPNDANRLGIGMVHQHFMLVECFTGLENIILGAEPTDKLGVLHKKRVRGEIERLCEKYHFNVDLDLKVSDMTVGMQQKIEILKMLYRKNDILIFDEPTAVLTPQEIDELIVSIKELANEGKSILFISHKLNEIMEVSDKVTILRKGKYIGTVNTKETNVNELSSMMVGRQVQLTVDKQVSHPGKEILSVRNLHVYSPTKHKMVVNDVNFDVHQGEIVCIAGIEGNGQSELIYGITGLTHVKSGHVYLRNVPHYDSKGKFDHYHSLNITHASIHKKTKSGIAHIPEDRHKYGLVLDFPLSYNLALDEYSSRKYNKLGWFNYANANKYANSAIENYDIRSGQGKDSIVRSMSGGNQQKAIVARELDRNMPLLIACQPTRGLDVGAIETIHKLIIKTRDEGKAVLLLSMELEEVMNLADRILVMFEGKIVADLNPKETNFNEIGLYMSGTKKMDITPLPSIDIENENKKLSANEYDPTYHYENCSTKAETNSKIEIEKIGDKTEITEEIIIPSTNEIKNSSIVEKSHFEQTKIIEQEQSIQESKIREETNENKKDSLSDFYHSLLTDGLLTTKTENKQEEIQ